jgi:hypothetical protein
MLVSVAHRRHIRQIENLTNVLLAPVLARGAIVRMAPFLLSVILLPATAVPQQGTPPSANTTVPSLEDTMQTIHDGMLDQHTYAGEYKTVKADAGNCTLSWTTVNTYAEKPPLTQQTEQKLSFHDLANVSVAYDELAANWNLELYAAAGKKVEVHSYFFRKSRYPCAQCKKISEARTQRSKWFIYFTAEEQANREAKAISQAMEVCRGGERLPR